MNDDESDYLWFVAVQAEQQRECKDVGTALG